jgi:hypothetical protein
MERSSTTLLLDDRNLILGFHEENLRFERAIRGNKHIVRLKEWIG